MNQFILFVAMFLTANSGCAPATLRATDERLSSYVDLFRSEAQKRAINVDELNYLKITIVSESEMPGLHGVCVTESGTNTYGVKVTRRNVMISEAAMSKGEFAAKVTTFHELSHCMLGGAHKDGTTNVSISQGGVSYSGSMPLSLMNSHYFQPAQVAVAELYWDGYVDELFGLKPNPFQ
jgi:hypothetical protein